PDYAFDDDGVRPWVWRSDDGYQRVAEPVPGGERYYYYQPGADEPFYVQDPDYGYGYAGGALVVLYDRAGRAIRPDRRATLAGRRGAGLRAGPRRGLRLRGGRAGGRLRPRRRRDRARRPRPRGGPVSCAGESAARGFATRAPRSRGGRQLGCAP